ncbi:conserved hypothetical protein [Rhodococcus sp. RD6.2]|uniref:hypothetical protein n=1 Tax=Rhodococcus sp. RD6.2 TaxID=260936 RepID=UPI00063B130E|nr:hypothetical protein [Rhodococcus sp. RD6.2]CRK51170.1 conserved hypothetical protein [Rhodococcus sp. RD6.2]
MTHALPVNHAVSANHGAPAPLGAHRRPDRGRRNTALIALISACPVGVTAALLTGSPGLTGLVAAGTACCVALAGVMI